MSRAVACTISTGAASLVTVPRVHAGAEIRPERFNFEENRPAVQDPLLISARMCGHIRVAVQGAIGRVDAQIFRGRRRAFVVTDNSGYELSLHALPILDKERQAHWVLPGASVVLVSTVPLALPSPAVPRRRQYPHREAY